MKINIKKVFLVLCFVFMFSFGFGQEAKADFWSDLGDSLVDGVIIGAVEGLTDALVDAGCATEILSDAYCYGDYEGAYYPEGYDPNNGDAAWSVDHYTGYGLPDGTIFGIIENIMEWLLTIVGVVGIIGFIVSGVLYLISAGDAEMLKKAKSAMKASIIGVIVAIAGVVALQAADALLMGGPF